MGDDGLGRDKNRATAHIMGSPTQIGSRRNPRQERAKFTVAAILEAAAEVTDDLGWGRASTNRIAERAGVSIGSLYQYFPNKEAILARMVEKHRESVHAVVDGGLTRLDDPTIPVESALQRLFEDLVELHREDPVLTRVLSTAVPHFPVGKDHAAESEHLICRLQRVLEARPDLRVRDVAAAAHVLATTTEALTRWLAHEAPESLDTPTLIDEIVAMLAGYLTGGSIG